MEIKIPNYFSGFSTNVKYDLLREVCKKSLYRFVQEFWHVAVPQKPVWNWHIEYLCSKLQGMFENVESGKPKDYDIILNLPPSSSKSSICSILFPCWATVRFPEVRLITASFSSDLAEDFSDRKSVV